MPLKPETHEFQSKLSKYCRTQELEAIPGVRDDRVPTYRRLVFGVVTGALENAYPVTKATLGEERWLGLVNEFFAKHNAASPELWHFPQELLAYAKENDLAARFNCPYLEDLLLFEWVEIDVFMMKDIKTPKHSAQGDVFQSELLINPHFRILSLEYPVFKKVDKSLLEQKGQYFLHVYRDPETDKVRFSELAPLAVCSLQLIADEPLAGKDILEASAAHLGLPADDEFFLKGRELLERLISDSIILGFVE